MAVPALPLVLGPEVKVTVHFPDDRVHEPPIVGLSPLLPVQVVIEKLTVPVGVIVVPDEVSETVTVQVAVLPPGPTLEGEQLTDTLTVLLLAVMVAVPELPAWVVSPP